MQLRFRRIFRICFDRFSHCVQQEKHLSRVSLEHASKSGRKTVWGRKNEEFIADFLLVSRRNLTERQLQIFRFHFLLGADWKLYTRRLGIDKGTFFHEVYRIEQRLGRVYAELQPYGLFPLDEYFNGTTCTTQELRSTIPSVPRFRPDSLHFLTGVPVLRVA